PGQRGLAAAALPDDGGDGAAVEREGDVVDGLHHVVGPAEVPAQVAGLEYGGVGLGHSCASTGSPGCCSDHQHRAYRWSSPTAGGSSVVQMSMARLHRGWKRQAAGGAARSGGEPLMPRMRRPRTCGSGTSTEPSSGGG